MSIDPVNAPAGTASYSLAAGTVHLVTQASDPNKRVKATEVFAVARTPYSANTTYRAQGQILVDGVRQSVNYTFTTGQGYSATLNEAKYLVSAR